MRTASNTTVLIHPVLICLITALLLTPVTALAAPGKTADLLTFIRALEAPRGYDDYERRIPIPPPRSLTRMTIAEVINWQHRLRKAGAKSTAAGGYQIIYTTLTGLVNTHRINTSQRFDRAMQDRLARLLIGKCTAKSGTRSAQANCIARIWAALPLVTGPKRGQSAYHGIAGNRALTTPERYLAVLNGLSVPLPRHGQHTRTAALSDQTRIIRSEVLAFGARKIMVKTRTSDINTALEQAHRTGGLTPSVREWTLDPYASEE